jgi:hypothetical protein
MKKNKQALSVTRSLGKQCNTDFTFYKKTTQKVILRISKVEYDDGNGENLCIV